MEGSFAVSVSRESRRSSSSSEVEVGMVGGR